MTQIVTRKTGYLVRVPLGKDAAGKRLYHNKTLRSKKEAERYATQVLHDLQRGTFVEPSKQSLSEYLDVWLRDVAAQRVRRRTVDDYNAVADRYLRLELGNLPLGQLTTAHLDRLYAGMKARNLSARTIEYAHTVIRSALGHAVRRGLIAINPAIDAVRPKKAHREMNYLTPDEANRFIAAAAETRFDALWIVLVTPGIRPGEALGLKWSDLDGNRLSIRRSLVRLRAGDIEEQAPKTERARVVLLPDMTVRALHRHRIRQHEERLLADQRWEARDYVFTTQLGGPLEWRVVARRYFKPILKAAGITKAVRPYDLRHTCATLLLAAGEHPKVVSERLGHAKITQTLDTYSHVLPDMQQAAAEKLELLLCGAAKNAIGGPGE